MAKLSVRDLPIKNKKIFLRVDFNVPLDENSKITDDTRIRESLPTIDYIINQGGIPILASHLGRPKGKIDPKQSLAPVARKLGELLKRNVLFTKDCIGPDVRKMVGLLKPGDVLLLENLRFHAEEEKNDQNFAKELAAIAEYYVNDAFGSAHRAHASVEAITHYFKEPACGFLMEKELEYFDRALKNPQRPLLAIIGGAKVSTKIGVLENLLKNVDRLVIGGGMCFTFYKAKGMEIGKSLCEDDFTGKAGKLLSNPKLYLPSDVMVVEEPKAGNKAMCVEVAKIPADLTGVDIGGRSIKEICEHIRKAKTIVWNGPMGIFEIADFSNGTRAVAQAVAEATKAGAITIVGGGDTVAALSKFKLTDKISHVSTGGGASLEYLEGIELPGIKALKDK